ncbi:Der GTPase-activating protein YihI [Pseudoalteromonas xiamenensis]|uniref:Der GTPase-activating protein YihI n=1 Tax=Pseudoalteromonas xiamenensis TaxID=882626 RepID=UPI0027E515E6|nr:Der GTPase-activating protein YihI [Pseudoalteromonas xiamenensis]WMN61319.1 Der GTPase-activating protein YihI [Pseudoalteromonas xiamenensis]
MTRKKKSRKVSTNIAPKLSKEKLQALRAAKEARAKKQSKGLKAGSRNAQEAKVVDAKNGGSSLKDARIGSKKPIALVPTKDVQPANDEPKFNRSAQPQVVLKKVVEPTLTPEEELAQLENDERLMVLIDRHERGELLTGKDAKFFNKSIARHQELCEILGIDDEFEEDEIFEADPMAQFMSDDLAKEWFDDEDMKD